MASIPLLTFFLFQSGSSTSAIPGFILILSIAGAVVDYSYKRNGGTKSSRRDKIVFWSVAGAIALLMAVLDLMGVNPGLLGAWTVYILLLLFAGWEVRRWMTRQDHPLPQKSRPTVPPKA